MSSKKTQAAERNVYRLNNRLLKKNEQLQNTKDRYAERIRKAEEALVKAQQRLEKAKQDAERMIAKRTAEFERTQAQTIQAERKHTEMLSKPAKQTAAAGTVETEAGEVRQLNKQTVETIKKAIGRKRSGALSPLDGAEAQSVLSAIDANGNVGDIFQVSIKGRKTALVFSVEEDGLHFETVKVSAAKPVAMAA